MSTAGGRQRHRSWPRISVHWDAWCTTPGAASELLTVCDVSAQGAFLVTMDGRTLPTGQRLSVRLKSPDGGLDVTAEATVRWAGPSLAHGRDGFGIEFVDIVEE